MCDMPIFECLPCVPELCLDFCLLKTVCLNLLLHLLASHSSSHDRSNFISIFLSVSSPCIVQCFFVSVMFLMDLLASMFNSLAHKDLPFLGVCCGVQPVCCFNGIQRRCAEIPVWDRGQLLLPRRAGGRQSSGVWRVSTADPEPSPPLPRCMELEPEPTTDWEPEPVVTY